MERILDLYCALLKGVIALCLAVMVVLVFGNVVLRYGFNSGIAVSEELSRWLLVWLTFLGAIVAVREHAHLGVDSLGYLDVEGMVRATGKPVNKFCLACFTGNYPLPVDPELDKYIMEKREGRSKALAAEEASPNLFANLK